MIQHNISNAFQLLVPGNGNRRQQRRLIYGGVDCDNAFHSALGKHLRISIQQDGIVAVHYGQKEIIALP